MLKRTIVRVTREREYGVIVVGERSADDLGRLAAHSFPGRSFLGHRFLHSILDIACGSRMDGAGATSSGNDL